MNKVRRVILMLNHQTSRFRSMHHETVKRIQGPRVQRLQVPVSDAGTTRRGIYYPLVVASETTAKFSTILLLWQFLAAN
jgi:hypothetical protein